MTELELLRAILDSYPYAIVYVDSDFIIRYMNRYARYHYCVERGYGDLIDKSLFDCRAPQSREKSSTRSTPCRRTARSGSSA